MNFKKYVKGYKNFPKQGIKFWDFTYLLKDVTARDLAINEMLNYLKNYTFDKIVAVESKGFTIGSILADRLRKPIVLIRKPNLIPDDFISQKFVKEYGEGEYQIKKDAVIKNEKVVIVYDIMAGEGATNCCIDLVNKAGGIVEACIFVTELEYLQGRQKIKCPNLFSLVRIENDKGN